MAPDRQSAARIGIVLVGLGRINQVPLRYLLTHLNTRQSAFEYEILPTPDHELVSLLASAAEVDRDIARALLPTFGMDYRSLLEQEISGYGLKEPPPSYFLVISMALLRDRFYTLREPGVSVLTLGTWERAMAPPSILEFALTLVLRESCAAVSPSLSGSIHLGTKGCLFDFTASHDEVRYKVLSGFICSHCRESLAGDGHPELADQLVTVLKKEWLGKPTEACTPANVASNLGYNLFVTKGMKVTLWERFRSALQEEGLKETIKAVPSIFAALVVLAFALALGLKAA